LTDLKRISRDLSKENSRKLHRPHLKRWEVRPRKQAPIRPTSCPPPTARRPSFAPSYDTDLAVPTDTSPWSGCAKTWNANYIPSSRPRKSGVPCDLAMISTSLLRWFAPFELQKKKKNETKLTFDRFAFILRSPMNRKKLIGVSRRRKSCGPSSTRYSGSSNCQFIRACHLSSPSSS
jgi:hypothetical protein